MPSCGLLVAWPVAIVATAFAIAFAIFLVLGDTGSDRNFTGGVFSLYGFTMAFYFVAMTQTFPLALGFSVTRREFFTATTVIAVGQSVVFGAVLYLLARLERATDGWGVQMRMFDLPAYLTSNTLLQWFLIFSTLLVVAAVSMFLATVYQRWRTAGLYATGIATVIVAGVASVVITWQRWWPAIGDWLVDTPRVVTLAVLPVAVAV
ncbi:MAG: ABC transporter permease, partial [Aldersonia sp.]|nr:ABC transporter permease [Aldersonia sp.]